MWATPVDGVVDVRAVNAELHVVRAVAMGMPNCQISSTMSKSVTITQSNYVPWKGYFDLIRASDEFILYDNVQYTRRDWRNRNLIKTPAGLRWLTIPVEVHGKYHQSVETTRIAEPGWHLTHWRSIETNYARAAGFASVAPWLRDLLESVADVPLLSVVNERLLRAVCVRLRITTPILRSTDLLDREAMQDMNPTDRLLQLCVAAGATRYLSGPSARNYLETTRFDERGIEVVWMDYDHYPEYPQLWGTFSHGVSIVDLLLNVGDDASRYLKPA